MELLNDEMVAGLTWTLHAYPVNNCSKTDRTSAYRFFIYQHKDLELAKKIIGDMKVQTPCQHQTLEENFLLDCRRSRKAVVLCAACRRLTDDSQLAKNWPASSQLAVWMIQKHFKRTIDKTSWLKIHPTHQNQKILTTNTANTWNYFKSIFWILHYKDGSDH